MTKKRALLFSIIAIALIIVIAAILYVSCTKNKAHLVREQVFTEVTEASPEHEDAAEEEYPCPIDFSSLKNINPEIYAWLDIPNTNISHAVLQSDSDDAFYLSHDEYKNTSKNGILFTEKTYNSTDFNDPVTIIYGHCRISGEIFGELQKYYSGDVSNIKTIDVYTPECLLEYTVFAAVPFSNKHLLYYYDFNDTTVFNDFFRYILAKRDMGSYTDRSVSFSEGDKVLILSTCLKGNISKRYLVAAKLTNIKNFY